MRVLVTGATGFLGGHILAALADEPDIEVIAACRRPELLPAGFAGERRVGDLTDGEYRKAVLDGVDAVAHAGTWAAFWGHRELEEERFFTPAVDLIDRCAAHGVQRFILAGTVAMGAASPISTTADRDRPPPAAPFWPHLDLLQDLERHMRARATRSRMISLRLGHFVGPGNRMGLLPALVPRLRTRLVPWLSGGRARWPVITGDDLGRAFVRALRADTEPFDAFAISGPEFPTAREFITFLADELGVAKPRYSVPYGAAHALASFLERTDRFIPGPAPFLTRSTVHLAGDWHCPDERADAVLGYRPSGDWRAAVRASLQDPEINRWPRLIQR
jgi:nucleoside-diphosphate-sugar epimerase